MSGWGESRAGNLPRPVVQCRQQLRADTRAKGSPGAAPADALEQSRNPSSTASNDEGTAVQDNVHPDVPANEASELPSDTADLASACLEHVKNILQALRCAGATHGSQDVFHLVKNILEHFSVNTLDEDTECLVAVVPDKDERAVLLVDVAVAFETEGASPADIVNQLVDLVSDLPAFSPAPPTSKPTPASSCPPQTPGAPPTPTTPVSTTVECTGLP